MLLSILPLDSIVHSANGFCNLHSSPYRFQFYHPRGRELLSAIFPVCMINRIKKLSPLVLNVRLSVRLSASLTARSSICLSTSIPSFLSISLPLFYLSLFSLSYSCFSFPFGCVFFFLAISLWLSQSKASRKRFRP